MKIHLQWIAPFREGMNEAKNYHLVIDTEEKTFERTFSPYVSNTAIEVKRKSDLEDLCLQLRYEGYKIERSERDNVA